MNRTHAVRVHFSGQQRLRSSVCSLSKVAQFQLQGRQQCAIALALDCKFVYLKTANTCSCPSIVNIVIRQELYDCMTKTNHPSFPFQGSIMFISCAHVPLFAFLLNTEHCFAFFMLAHIHIHFIIVFLSLFHYSFLLNLQCRYKAVKTLKQMLDFSGGSCPRTWGGKKVHYRPVLSVD